jgi:signal transduction histidine kinase/CheY-like chemotaxis protein
VDDLVKLLTRDYLSRRFFIAISAFIFSLALIVGIGIQGLTSFQTYVRFSALFTELFEVTTRLEMELEWSAAQRATPEPSATLAARYRDALATFSALRATDADGHEERQTRWDLLEAEYRIDPEAERARLGLGDRVMPSDLHEVWHAPRGAGAQLGDVVAEFLTLSQQHVERRGGDAAEHLRAVENLRNLSQTKLFPAFHNAALVITEHAGGSARHSLYLLIACAVAGLLATLFAALFLFRPLRRAVLENQDLLVKQRDRARASEEGNRQFLAMMSDELRTPMNGVIGFTDRLLATSLTEQQKEHAETIKESGQAVLDLLSSMLELSRIEGGPQQLEDADFSLHDLVGDVIALLGPQAVGKSLDLAAFVDPGLPEKLRGDPGRIRQILVSLIANAIEFTASGGVAIEVRQEGGSDAEGEGHNIHISVTNTGLDIAKDQIGHIFQRPAQADASPARPSEGAGLGLAISRELARLMGGRITVESAPDKGSTFSLHLTLANAQAPASGLSGRASVSFAGRRFLVVDNNALNRRILRLQLEAHGAEVECVSSARAALAALTQSDGHAGRYDLAIIDQTMPDIDGMALRKMIREQPEHAELRLIISSPGGIAFDQQARALGFDAACPKPVVQDMLIAKIQELLAPVTGGTVPRPVTLLPSKPPSPTAPTPEGRHLRLLVAEDNPINQRLIVNALKHAGFSVDVVGDGMEAVDAVQREPYDLVLMDIRMPVMNGVEATQRIRSLSTAAANLPIVAMTANAMAGDREEYLAAGMNDYVAKPIDFNILLTKIRAHLPMAAAESMASQADAATWVAEKRIG